MTTKPIKSERIEVRATPAERVLIDRAVAVSGSDLTTFVMSNLTVAAQRLLADRTVFEMDERQWRTWERINDEPARDLAGLRDLMWRPSPFGDG